MVKTSLFGSDPPTLSTVTDARSRTRYPHAARTAHRDSPQPAPERTGAAPRTRDVLSAPLLVLASQGERTTILLELVDAAPFPAFGAHRDTLHQEVHTLTQAAFHAHAVKFDARGALAALRRGAALLAEEVHAWIRATRLRLRALPPETLPASELAAWPDLPRLRPYLAATLPRLDAALAALAQPLTAALIRVLAPDLPAAGATLRARAAALLDELNQATAASIVASRDAEAARERLEVWYRQLRRVWTAILAHDPTVLPKLDLEACQQAAAVVRPRARRPSSGDPPPSTRPDPAARETCRPVDDLPYVAGSDPRARCDGFDSAAALRGGDRSADANERMTSLVEPHRSPADRPIGAHGGAPPPRPPNHRNVRTRSATRREDGSPPAPASRHGVPAASRTAPVDTAPTSPVDTADAPATSRAAPAGDPAASGTSPLGTEPTSPAASVNTPADSRATAVDPPAASRAAPGAAPDTAAATSARRPPADPGATQPASSPSTARSGAPGAPTTPSSPTEAS